MSCGLEVSSFIDTLKYLIYFVISLIDWKVHLGSFTEYWTFPCNFHIELVPITVMDSRVAGDRVLIVVCLCD